MSASAASQAPARVPFAEAFRFWLKLGFVSFGGPTGQIAIIHQELVERRRWISEGRFLHALNYCMVLPGPEATQLAAYIGWLMHRTWGGIVAGTLFFLPSAFILAALSWIYLAYGEVPLVAAGLIGYLGGRFAPEKFSAAGTHAASRASYGPALIDDGTPTPAYALFSWRRLWAYAGAGIAIWAVALGALAAASGWEGPLTQMG